MPVSKKRKKVKKKQNKNNIQSSKIKTGYVNCEYYPHMLYNIPKILSSKNIDDENFYKIEDKEAKRVPSQRGNWIVIKNTTDAHLEIVEGQEIEPGTLMKDTDLPNKHCFPEGSYIVKDMTPNTYDYVTSDGYDLCYNGGRLTTISRKYDDNIDRVYAVYSPTEGEPEYKVFADIYVKHHDYHELVSIASFRRKETLMKWIECPIGHEEIIEFTLALGEYTEPIESDNESSFINPAIIRGQRKMRELFAERYPDNETYSDEEVETLFEDFKYRLYSAVMEDIISSNKELGKMKEFRFRDRLRYM